MGTFLEFYKVDKNKVSEKMLKYLNMDQIESNIASDKDASFFDLTIDWEFPDIIELVKFSRTGQIRQVMNAFMSSKGIVDDIYNTSMVMSKQLVAELITYLNSVAIWDTEDVWFSPGEKEFAVAFFQRTLNTHDFDNEYFFYTYY